MNTLTKSAIVAATIAGAAATSLRFEVAANSNFEQSLKMQSWETSFLEKAAEAYDCVGTTLHQITEVAEKSAAKLTTVEAECLLEGSTSRYVAAQTEHDATLSTIDENEKKRATGDFPNEYDCVGQDCETPNTIRIDTKKENLRRSKFLIGESDDRVTASGVLVNGKKLELETAQEAYDSNDAIVATTIATKTADIQDAIDAIATQLTDDKNTALTNKQDAISDADTAETNAKNVCDTANTDRLGVIADDEKLVGEIKGDLATLRMCTARHNGGTEFLEIKAAQRLEAHCAVSQKKVAQAAPSGDLTDWLAKIETEKTAAAATLKQCYANAEETKREKIQGDKLDIDGSSGINYEYTAAVASYELDAAAKTTKAEKKIATMTAEENKKKIPFQQKMTSAKQAYDAQVANYAHDVADEKKEKLGIQNDKDDKDADADSDWTSVLKQQENHLSSQRKSEMAAFETSEKDIKAGCTKDIELLQAEGDTIAKVKAKIALLKVVGREPGAAAPTDGQSDDTAAADKPAATQNECMCANGVAATGTACTTNRANICSSCVSSYWLFQGECFLKT